MNPPKTKPKTSRKLPWNALMPEERSLVESIIRSADYADHSVRELCLTLLEETGIYVSPVTFWAFQVKAACNGPRRGKRLPKGRGNKPDTSQVDGPNQLWSWDITHLPTGRAYEFWYLYALMDWHSRKVVAWLITDRLDSSAARELWDLGLLNEGLLLKPSAEWPESLSDRGTQMRSISTRRYFHNIGVTQIFARPRTPNDNARTEALFSTTKTEPEYPGHFPKMSDAISYFNDFYHWFNEGHTHTALRMLTPSQVHAGQGESILAVRRNTRDQTIARRREYHSTGDFTQSETLTLSGRRQLPLRFQYPLPEANNLKMKESDCAINIRHLLIN